ncbi:hypothetical protein Emed_002516 [Eimeria media]
MTEMRTHIPFMVALVPRLPGSRKPRGSSRLTHSAGVIVTAKTHWLRVCLVVWLCIALLGLCVTSTRSFRANDTNLWSAAPATAAADTPHKSPSLHALSDEQALYGTRSHLPASSPVGVGVYRHNVTGNGRVARRALAAVPFRRITWFGSEASRLWLASPVRGFEGSPLSQAALKCDGGTARVCFQIPRVSMLFSASSLAPSSEQSLHEVSYGADGVDDLKGSEGHDLPRQDHTEKDVSIPAGLQLRAHVHAEKAPRRFLSFRGFSARVGSALTAIVQKVQATKAGSSLLQELTGFNAGSNTSEGDERPLFSKIHLEDGEARECANRLRPTFQNQAKRDDQTCGEKIPLLDSDGDASLSANPHLPSSSDVACEGESASSSPNEQSETNELRGSADPDTSEGLADNERSGVEDEVSSPQLPEAIDAASKLSEETERTTAAAPSSGGVQISGQLDSGAARTEEEWRPPTESSFPTHKEEQTDRESLEATRLQSTKPHATDIENEAQTRPKSAGARHEKKAFLREDLPTAVSEELLAILQGGSVKHQAIAARALVALLTSESKRTATQAQAYLVLPDLSQPTNAFASRDIRKSKSDLVDHLLRKGLVEVIQRILSAPPPKPFWSRWLQRDVSSEDTEALELLQLRVQLLRLLSVLLSFGAEAERHIVEHAPLMKAIYRMAKPSSAEGVRAHGDSCLPTALKQRSVEAFSPPHSPQRSAASGPADLRDAEALRSQADDIAGSDVEDRGTTTHEISSSSPDTSRLSQPLAESANDFSSHQAGQPSGAGAYTSREDFASGCGAHPQQPAASPPFASDASATRVQTAGAGEGIETNAAEGFVKADSKSYLSEPAHEQASLLAAESALSASKMLRATAEKLAVELMDRLSEPTGEAATGSPESAITAGGTQLQESVNAVKSQWWKSFLVPFGEKQSTGAAAIHRVDDREARSKAVSAASQSHEGFPDTWRYTEGAEVGFSQKATANAGLQEEDVLDQSERTGFLRMCKRVFSACIPSSLKALRAKPGAANNEGTWKLFWIPVCLSAGDAGLWASLAAVAGQDLADAIKDKVMRHLHAEQRQQPSTMGDAASLSPPSSDFLSLLREITIGSSRSSGSHTAAWGVLGLTTEEISSTKIRDSEGTSSNGISEVDGTNTSAFSGEVVAKDTRYRFQMLCMLRDQPSFRGSVQTLGVGHLLNALSSGTQETKLGALETLTQLLRSRAKGVSQNIHEELRSDVFLHAFEQGLEEALLAPYSRRRRWGGGASEAACEVSEKLQVAALDFLYAVCVADESVIHTLQKCASLKTALHRVIHFCKRRSIDSRSLPSQLDKESPTDSPDSSVAALVADDAALLKVVKGLPPGERHMKVLQEHARPLRLATIVASALGAQPKWKPRVPGQRGLRILALDGGGTRGVLTVAVLKHIAASVGRELSEVFDIICGTSTGGIIAVLLGMEKASAVELEALYDTLINEIFVKDSAAVAGARLVVRQAYYDESLWESLLMRAFGDTRMIEFAADESVPKVFCLSTMMSTNPAKLVVWRNYNYPSSVNRHPKPLSLLNSINPFACFFQKPQKSPADNGGMRYSGSCCVRVRDALRATTAAPGFFIGKKVGADFFVDGALLANNPAAVAIGEAKALYPGVPIELVVSVGTGQCPSERCDARTGWDGIFNQLVNAATNTEAIHELLKDVLPESVYFRLNPEIDAISIDETSREKLEGLKLAAKRFFEDPRNKKTIQRLVDVLQPASPLQKHTRVLMRSVSSRTASLSRWIQNLGSNSLKAASRSVHGPLSISDSSFLRFLKCCLLPGKSADNTETNVSSQLLRRSSEEKCVPNDNCSPEKGTSTAGSESDFSACAPVEEGCDSASASIKHQTLKDEGPLSLDAHLFPSGRRSFLAWLLRSPRSKPGKGSSGIFDMLEVLGRRHESSSVHRKELESLVPLTGVRHVLHGIFQLVGGQLQ